MSNKTEFQIFCQNIKEIRKRYNLTKKEMSKTLGISLMSLNKIENGILPPRLTADVIIRASIAFKISPSALFSVDVL